MTTLGEFTMQMRYGEVAVLSEQRAMHQHDILHISEVQHCFQKSVDTRFFTDRLIADFFRMQLSLDSWIVPISPAHFVHPMPDAAPYPFPSISAALKSSKSRTSSGRVSRRSPRAQASSSSSILHLCE